MSEAGIESSDSEFGDDGKDAEVSARLDRLVGAVESLASEVEGLGERLDRLEASRPRRTRSSAARSRRRSSPSVSVDVVMRPVTELAMAAVAERALRKARAVHSVTRSEGDHGDEHSARYRVEVEPGADLVGEVGETLPVSFNATESEPGVLLFDLKW